MYLLTLLFFLYLLQKIDYIYYTGDFADHFDYSTSRQSVQEAVKFVTDVVKNSFPGKLFVPMLGNHDSHPSDL